MGWPWVFEVVASIALFPILRRLIRGALTLPARAPLPWLLRRVARFVGPSHLTGDAFFSADGVGAPWVSRRRAAFEHLSSRLGRDFGQSAASGDTLRESFSDLRFTDLSRVPFPFARVMHEHFSLFSMVTESRGPWLKDVNGEWTLDVSGSHGLNVAGFRRYHEWIQRGVDRVAALGPVLGPIHPVVAENVDLLKRASGLDEVSFHMSGTEAVMAAVRMARFNTRRRLIVCFSGACHGWWDGVQPGLGSEREIGDCLTLKELSQQSIRVIRQRASEIAGVLVNPIQALHPNAPPPSDAVLLTSNVRRVSDGADDYRVWLNLLRDVCTGCDVPLIFDEVYTGFRLAPGGAQEHFGVRADMVVYGKTVGGGMPIGVVVGRSALMKRVDPARPMRMAYIVGTFSAHPVVMAAMNEFLRWVMISAARTEYEITARRCGDWVRGTNRRLADANLPIRIASLTTIWTVLFTESSRYNWLFQYYLRAEGVSLSWVGTGRCLISMDFTDEDYESLQTKIVTAAQAMKRDAWWLTTTEVPNKQRLMRKQLVREMVGSFVPAPLRAFHAAVMQRRSEPEARQEARIGAWDR